MHPWGGAHEIGPVDENVLPVRPACWLRVCFGFMISGLGGFWGLGFRAHGLWIIPLSQQVAPSRLLVPNPLWGCLSQGRTQVTSKVVSFRCEGASAPWGKDLRPYFLLLWQPLPRHTYKQDVRGRTGGHDARSDCLTTHWCCLAGCRSPLWESFVNRKYHVSCTEGEY